ncbi:MAG: carbon starvation CstA family protein [Methanocorpusculum sp.]|uniref:carbon starvation CstA family protein n=1 Tax=Methanocorpusculum sp. TaxID=2058474 RepID=UPI00272458FA|nr:carbon starvation CstA family protein [Methanocorpusculum sp.]MDO9522996.1 carbon starvation CstA family protein [Methanocorpusculum sp.]
MITFLVGICILIFGYFFWSKVAEKIFGPDDRKTPALNHPDAVERVPLSTRRNLLIQLLNIAGMGPVVGVVLGMKFGAIVFLLLPIGNVIGGAVHDYYVGMISARNNGSDMTSLVNKFFGRNVGGLFIVLVILSLLLLVTTFTNIPANFIQLLLPFGVSVLICAVIGIFVYYIISTIFPIDKVVGRIYPIFGVALIVVTALLCIAYIPFASDIPDIVLTPAGIAAAFTAHPDGQPIIPMLFITIACGILSGFHATQSPITSRTITSEREGRRVFYGMMIAEGIIAMIWAAGASIIFTLKPEMLASTNGNAIIFEILDMVFPTFLIVLAIIVLIILAITSGDTALRVIRTSVAGHFGFDQSTMRKRILLALPLVAVITMLLFWSNLIPTGYAILWNYFSWFNQVIASFALMTATVYLISKGKPFWISMIPGVGILFIVISFILWASPEHLAGVPFGIGMPLEMSYVVSGVLTAVIYALVIRQGRKLKADKTFSADEE